jgi:uridine kinase
VDEGMIMVFEGVFICRRELSPYLDYRIFLEIPFEVSKRRAAARDIPIYSEEILERYDRKYWPAQRRYLEEYPPLQTADMIVDNLNWECPVIKYIR